MMPDPEPIPSTEFFEPEPEIAAMFAETFAEARVRIVREEVEAAATNAEDEE